MDTMPFFDYLHEHAATAWLAESLAEIVRVRRARATVRMIPVVADPGSGRVRRTSAR